MKKKKSKKKPVKQKIDVVLESLLNLERVVKELIKKVEGLQYSQPYYPKDNEQTKKYWPNTDPPFKYKDIMWNDNSSDHQIKTVVRGSWAHAMAWIACDDTNGEPVFKSFYGGEIIGCRINNLKKTNIAL